MVRDSREWRKIIWKPRNTANCRMMMMMMMTMMINTSVVFLLLLS